MTDPSSNPLAEDLDHILAHTRDLWEELRGRRIFITGGTGFFGCWLLESFAWANDTLKLDSEALVLSRNPDAFEKKAPHLFHHPAIRLLKGDIRDFDYPQGRFSCLIHAAVYQQPAGAKPGSLTMANEMLDGMRHVLDFCEAAEIRKMLLISTGAVYGKPPARLEKIPENFSGAFDPTATTSAYHQVRRMMEALCVLYAAENDFEAKIARCFSFIGPYLPLNGRFAVSDFILDALSKRPIDVNGDGKAVRAYLYMSDLTIWLLTILFSGINSIPYNVGSDFATTIREIAELIANESFPPISVSVLGTPADGFAPSYYVPDTKRAQSGLGLRQVVTLPEAIKKTLFWYRNNFNPS